MEQLSLPSVSIGVQGVVVRILWLTSVLSLQSAFSFCADALCVMLESSSSSVDWDLLRFMDGLWVETEAACLSLLSILSASAQLAYIRLLINTSQYPSLNLKVNTRFMQICLSILKVCYRSIFLVPVLANKKEWLSHMSRTAMCFLEYAWLLPAIFLGKIYQRPRASVWDFGRQFKDL